MTTIHVDALTVHFGARTALLDVNGLFPPGRRAAIIGPNGAGKTTLVRCIAGVQRPTTGVIRLDDQPAHRTHGRALAMRIAYHGQGAVPRSDFSVREMVELGRFAVGRDPVRINEVLRLMALEEIATLSFRTLSAGNRQRVLLARAIAQLEPGAAILLDEPFTALDVAHVRGVLRVLDACAANGHAVIMTTHRFDIAAAFADDVWLLRDGRVLEMGQASSVLDCDRLEATFGADFEVVRATLTGGTIEEWCHPVLRADDATGTRTESSGQQ